MTDYSRFQNLRYTDFRRMAQDSSLSEFEKIGFPDSYREGLGSAIFADIRRKLPHLERRHQTVLEIGPGCSEPPRLMIDLCRQHEHTLILIDSPEMLALLPDAPFITKIPAYYPDECPQLFEEYAGRVDVINCYSVLPVIFSEGNVYRFFDRTLSLMASDGQFLLGDIPNVSTRKRFFSSERGAEFHRFFTTTDEPPIVAFNTLEPDKLDDAVLMSLVMRARAAGFNAYWLPLASNLPLANRREDLLIYKP